MVNRTDKSAKILLISIIALAFLLRFMGIWWGYPALLHGGERGEIVSGAFEILDFNSSGGVTEITHNGPLLKYLMALIFGIWGVVGSAIHSLDGMVELWKSTTVDHIVARVIMELIAGTLTVWLMYRIGLRFARKTTFPKIGTGPQTAA